MRAKWTWGFDKPVSRAKTLGMTELTPPIAETRPHSFTAHGVTIEDPYAWLKDPN